jgi:lipopolysaccharide/colanic/teichoic acid biosynthesis glycosyltransferase
MIKRAFDAIAAGAALVFLLPGFLIIAIGIKLDSQGPIFFRQERIGRGFRAFQIYKFRTMVPGIGAQDRQITCGDDPRITRFGKFLRRTKLDEFPQLINVVKGEMSIVGPRPEVRQYVEYLRQDFAEILQVRPGLTDLASLRFHNEAALLGTSVDPEELYKSSVLPQKIQLGKLYVRQSSLMTDFALIVKTLAVVWGLKSHSAP